MPTSVTWNGSARNVPNAGELNWSALSAFLVDLGNNAQTTNFQKNAVRVATTSPVTVSAATDCVVVTNLSVAGAVTVNLPAGSTKQVFYVVDGKGDAATNNITITPAAGTINGAATYVISTNRMGVGLTYNGSEWTVFADYSPLASTDVSQGLLQTNASAMDKTVSSGTTLTHANLSIQSGHDYVVSSGGSFVGLQSLTVNTGGTFTVNAGGSATVII